jgi:hypothetical protein
VIDSIPTPDQSCRLIHGSLLILVIIGSCITATAAVARDTASITQYLVTGKTAVEVHEDIKIHAPLPGPGRGL